MRSCLLVTPGTTRPADTPPSPVPVEVFQGLPANQVKEGLQAVSKRPTAIGRIALGMLGKSKLPIILLQAFRIEFAASSLSNWRKPK
jgi:hypothetical protein